MVWTAFTQAGERSFQKSAGQIILCRHLFDITDCRGCYIAGTETSSFGHMSCIHRVLVPVCDTSVISTIFKVICRHFGLILEPIGSSCVGINFPFMDETASLGEFNWGNTSMKPLISWKGKHPWQMIQNGQGNVPYYVMSCCVKKKEIEDGFSGFWGDYSLKAHFLDEVRVNGLGFFTLFILPSFIQLFLFLPLSFFSYSSHFFLLFCWAQKSSCVGAGLLSGPNHLTDTVQTIRCASLKAGVCCLSERKHSMKNKRNMKHSLGSCPLT